MKYKNIHKNSFRFSALILFLFSFFSKAFAEARTLALEAGIVSKDIIGELLAKAVAEMSALEDKVGALEIKEEPKEEAKEGE